MLDEYANFGPTPAAMPKGERPSAREALHRFAGIDVPYSGLTRLDALTIFIAFPLLVALYFGPLMAHGRVLGSLGSDITTYWYPIRHYTGQILAQGRIPFWNPWLQSGTPLLAANQPAAFYPLTWLFAFLPTGTVFNVQVLFGFWLGLSAMYVLLRRMGRTPLASMVGALVFGFSGSAMLRCLAGHIAFLSQWPFTAACVLCWFLIQERSCLPHARLVPAVPSLALAACLALQYFCGHPQLTYLTLLIMAGLHAGWAFYGFLARVRTAVLAGTAWLVAAGIMAALLVMLQALPAMLYTQLTVRATHAGWAYYEDQSMPPSNLFTLFAPWAWGGQEGPEDRFGNEFIWEVNAYLGATAIVLSLFCFARARRTPVLCWTCAAGAVVGLLLALGEYAPFYRMAFHVLPGLSLFRVPSRMLYLVIFAVSVLSAVGLDRVSRLAEEDARGLKRYLALLVALIVLLALAFSFLLARGPDSWFFQIQYQHRFPRAWRGKLDPVTTAPIIFWPYFRYTLLAFAIGLGALVVSVTMLNPLRRRVAKPALCALLLGELAVMGWPYRVSFDPKSLEWPPSLERRIASAGPLYRMGTASLTNDYNHGLMVGVRHVWGYEPAGSERYMRVMMKSQQQEKEGAEALIYTLRSTPFLNCLGLRYILSPPGLYPKTPSWTELGTFGKRVLYENPDAMPRLFTVANARVMSSTEVLDAVNDPSFQPATTVLLEEDPPTSSTIQQSEPPGAVHVERDDPETVTLVAEMQRPGWVVLMDQLLPGWTATVDGKPARIYRANAIGRAVHLEAGRHLVTMSYVAPGFAAGVAVSSIAWAAWLAAMAAAAVVSIRRGRDAQGKLRQ